MIELLMFGVPVAGVAVFLSYSRGERAARRSRGWLEGEMRSLGAQVSGEGTWRVPGAPSGALEMTGED